MMTELSYRQNQSQKKRIVVPDYFLKALTENKTALKTFEDFSPSHKREYVEWITEAKSEATKIKRLSTATEWLSQGRSRNWRYMKK